MSASYQNNHYVPVWYQKRFIPSESSEKALFYLDLEPGNFVDGKGIRRKRKDIRLLGPRHCFVQKDLYRTGLLGLAPTDIEQFFFGKIDERGKEAVAVFSNFEYKIGGNGSNFHDLLRYLSTQKLRTPKGLGWICDAFRAKSRDEVLTKMIDYQRLFCAIWTECVWQIAEAKDSDTKFIISDHPVTVYNRELGPRNQKCRGFNDPEIWLNGSHTLFPLSAEKILILTNLSWVRNPYQSAKAQRPHSNPLRDAMFMTCEVQTERYLTENEVRQINFIIKKRALRYVASGNKEWLFPEEHVSKSDWPRFGNGYLLMPEPRVLNFSTQTLIQYKSGRVDGFDEYGRRGVSDEADEEAREKESRTLDQFKAEFAQLIGRQRRGRTFEFGSLSDEEDCEMIHEYYLKLGNRSRDRR